MVTAIFNNNYYSAFCRNMTNGRMREGEKYRGIASKLWISTVQKRDIVRFAGCPAWIESVIGICA